MSKKQYPPQTGYYAVKVKSGQSTDNWQNFDTARLQISVGQEYHEGQKLSAMAAWCKERFKHVHFCVNDTLQRFNLMFEQAIGEEESQQVSSKLGEAWINRNMPIITGVPQAQIITWDEWKNCPAYPKGFLQTEWLYANNNEFRQSIDSNIAEIWKRRIHMKADLYIPERYDTFFSLSRRYLLEEMATFALMYDTKEAIDIYPGTTLFAATLFQGKATEGAPAGLGKGHFCRIDFALNKNNKPDPPEANL